MAFGLEQRGNNHAILPPQTAETICAAFGLAERGRDI
jgi:hypothetical protein